MAQLDPDQLAALRRLRAAFGPIEVLEVIDHQPDQDRAPDQAGEDDQTPGRGRKPSDRLAPLVQSGRSRPTSDRREAMVNAADVVRTYASAWMETDESARRRALHASWADDGAYCDPTALVEGREALVKHIGGFHAQMPAHQLVITSGVDEHHGLLRFTWAIHNRDGNVVLEGVDFGELADDGRLRRIVGFFGPAPAASTDQ